MFSLKEDQHCTFLWGSWPLTWSLVPQPTEEQPHCSWQQLSILQWSNKFWDEFISRSTDWWTDFVKNQPWGLVAEWVWSLACNHRPLITMSSKPTFNQLNFTWNEAIQLACGSSVVLPRCSPRVFLHCSSWKSCWNEPGFRCNVKPQNIHLNTKLPMWAKPVNLKLHTIWHLNKDEHNYQAIKVIKSPPTQSKYLLRQ